MQALSPSPLAWLDETGWRVTARLDWLRVAVTEQVTVFAIQRRPLCGRRSPAPSRFVIEGA